MRVGRAKLTQVTLSHNVVGYLVVRESTIHSPESRVRASAIDYLYFFESSVAGLSMEDTTIGRALALRKVRFDGLKLRHVHLARSVDIEAADVEYVDSERFPSSHDPFPRGSLSQGRFEDRP